MNYTQCQPLFKEQSTKSLNKYRSQSIEQRALKIGKELLLPGFQKKKQQKNIFTITTNTSSNSIKSHPPKSQEDLQKRVNVLQAELKRKLNEDSFLRNLFKTKHSSEMNHLDIYLQIRKFQDKMGQMLKYQEEQNKKISQYEYQMKQQEQDHMRNMEELSQCVSWKEGQWLEEKIKFSEEIEKMKIQMENNKFLMEEMKKKNYDLIAKYKQTSEQISMERDAHNLALIKIKSDYQKQIDEFKVKIAKIDEQNERNIQQRQILQQQLTHLTETLQSYKDKNKKLEIIASELQNVNRELQTVNRELQDVNREMVSKQQSFKKEQKDKYSIYYQKLRKDYEIQIQSLIRRHQEVVLQEKKQGLRILDKNKKLNEEKMIIQSRMSQKQKKLTDIQAKFIELQRQTASFNQEGFRWQEKNSKLSRQIKQIKFQKQEIVQRYEKCKFQLADLNIVKERLQKKISELTEQNILCNQKCDELKRLSEYSQSYLKLNDKIYNQNYKTHGRLIQINHKIRQYLGNDSQNKMINEQSLTEVVACLTQQLEQFIKMFTSERKEKEEFVRERNSENREIINVIEQCKHFIKNQFGQNLINKYISLVKGKRNSEQNSQKVEIYHQLVDYLMNLNNTKFYSSQNPHQAYEKDSLDSTYLIKNSQSNRKYSKNVFLQRQSSCKNVKRKTKMETEPSVYQLPLKRKLVIDEDDKQNVNLNLNKGQVQVTKKQRQKQGKRYINEVRQRLSGKHGSKWKDREQLRSQVQKKYFRS